MIPHSEAWAMRLHIAEFSLNVKFFEQIGFAYKV